MYLVNMNEEQFKHLFDLLQSLVGLGVGIVIILMVIFLFVLMYYFDNYYMVKRKAKEIEDKNTKNQIKDELIYIIDKKFKDVDYRITDYINNCINNKKS